MGRKQSKRIPLKRKHRIEKKVRDHNSKLRNLSKKIGKKKNRKDPGVPNSLPFKEEVLREIVVRKQNLKDEEEKKKEAKKQARLEAKEGKPKNLEELASDAISRGESHNAAVSLENEVPSEQICQAGHISRKYYFKEFKKVVMAADVILEVLDARDPMSCRCPDVEQEVLKAGKKLVLILNKIDLIPKQNAVDWIKILRRDLPTIPFKASTQRQRSALGMYKLKFTKTTTDILANSKSFGGDVLLKLIANYSRNNDIKTAITIGIIGLPNVGKSSIINSLKRARACSVGAYPGITKSMQTINLDSKVKLLDSPGIIMQKGVDTNSLILRNCIPMDNVTGADAVSVVAHMLGKLSWEQLALQYKMAKFENVEQFLGAVARKRGILRKGGIPNLERTAKLVINDWNTGVIHYYTQPPKLIEESLPAKFINQQAQIVSELSEEFDIDALLNDTDGSTSAEVQTLIEDAFIPVTSEGSVAAVTEEMLQAESKTVLSVPEVSMETGDSRRKGLLPARSKNVRFGGQSVKKIANNDEDDMEFEDVESDSENGGTHYEEVTGSLMVNKKMKLHLKHLKKMRKRASKLDSNLAEAAQNLMDIDSTASNAIK